MSVVREVRSRLAALESRVEPELRDEVRAIQRLLAEPDRQWIGTVEAQRLLGVQSINTVKAWARLGILRNRREPNGRLKVYLEDVLRESRAQQDLEAMGGHDEPLSREERDALGAQLPPEGEGVVSTIIRYTEARERHER
jgi:hypothetical protein